MTYTQPLLLILIAVMAVGLVGGGRRRRYLAWGGVLGLFVISWPPLDWLLARPLEAQYPIHPFEAPPGLQAIVVLGSSIEPPVYERPYPVPDSQTFKRCEYAAWVYRRCGPLPVLACQGRQRGGQSGNTMGELLRRAGVDEKLIWMETQSRSTHENAIYGTRILRQHGIQHIALVVDSQSMPRAAACFRKAGFDVTPAVAELRTWGPWSEELLPSWKAIQRNELTLHELLGLAWYRLRGWI